MDVDTLQPSPDPFAHSFKARKQRHTRQARAVISRESPSAEPTQNAPPVGVFDKSALGEEDVIMNDGNDTEDAESRLLVAEILRSRKMGRIRKGGLDFSTNKIRGRTLPLGNDETMAERDAVDKEVNAVVNRFTHQTGAVIDVDEHMMKYIETEIERRRLQDAAQANISAHESSDSDSRRAYPAPLTSTKISERRVGKWPVRPDFRGATLGKLQEIDLGAEHTQKNIERTEEMKRRLERGESLTAEQELENSKKRRRGKRRRNSVDIERDKMVEEVLKESRLDIYEEPELGANSGDNDDGDFAADDRIAEQFRREFLDALNARRRGRNTQNAKNKKEDVKRPRGPKLGGSRAARAAMRESERTSTKK